MWKLTSGRVYCGQFHRDAAQKILLSKLYFLSKIGREPARSNIHYTACWLVTNFC